MALQERHRQLLKEHRWSRVSALDTADGGIITDRCDSLQLSRAIRTPKVKGVWGQQEIIYVIDGDDREFSDLGDVAIALEEKGILTAVGN